jgi:hypothetical protein
MDMKKKILMILAILSISAVASAKTYSVKLFQRSLVAGAELQPGEYKMEINGSKVVISNGKKSAEAEVKVETGDQKFSSTSVRYQNGDGNYRVQEIRLGGTKTKLVFN